MSTNRFTANDIPAQYLSIIKRVKTVPSITSSMIDTRKHPGMDARELSDYAEKFSVFIEVEVPGGVANGSGVLISSHGYILTAAHVIRGAKDIRARILNPGTFGPKYLWFDAEVMRPVSENLDLAIIKIPGENYPYASIRPAEDGIEETEEIMLVGFPQGTLISDGDRDSLSATKELGYVSSVQDNDLCLTGIQATFGDSGGAMWSLKDGRIIGSLLGAFKTGKQDDAKGKVNFRNIRSFWKFFGLTAEETQGYEGKQEVEDDE